MWLNSVFYIGLCIVLWSVHCTKHIAFNHHPFNDQPFFDATPTPQAGLLNTTKSANI